MTTQELKELLGSHEYDFLRENKYLGNNIMLIALGGSLAYGTNVATSDVDIRGIAVNDASQLFGIYQDFGQVVDTNTDTVIYSILKMIKLLIECNPNTIEILGCKPEHYIYKDKRGEILLNHKDDFLSKAAIPRFGGYADAQYGRLQNALLGNGCNDDKKLEMLRNSLNRSLNAFAKMHSNLNFNIALRIVNDEELKSLYPDKDIENSVSNDHILVNGTFNNVPVTAFKNTISLIHKIQSDYGNINHRNSKKDDIHLAKHMMNLLRLYFMGIDLSSGAGVVTYREKEHDLLMKVRNGEFLKENNTKVSDDFYDILNDVQKKYEYSIENTVLPDNPNKENLIEMMKQIYDWR